MEKIKERSKTAIASLEKFETGGDLTREDISNIKHVINSCERFLSIGELVGGTFTVGNYGSRTFQELEELANSFRKVDFDKRYPFSEDKEKKANQLDKIYTLKQMSFENTEGYYILSDETHFWKSKTPF